MDFFKVLAEQLNFNFTGKINFVEKTTEGIACSLFLKDGKVVNVYHKGHFSKENLKEVFFLLFKYQDRFKFLVEPEIVHEDLVQSQYSLAGIRHQFESEISKMQGLMAQLPPPDISLSAKVEMFDRYRELSPIDFKVLFLITKYQKVSEIYANNTLGELLLVESLIKLRKKSLLKVRK